MFKKVTEFSKELVFEIRQESSGAKNESINSSLYLLNMRNEELEKKYRNVTGESIIDIILTRKQDSVQQKSKQLLEKLKTLKDHFDSEFGTIKYEHGNLLSAMEKGIREQSERIDAMKKVSGNQMDKVNQRLFEEEDRLQNMYKEASEEQRNATYLLDKKLSIFQSKLKEILISF
ncbi:hypothetical protein QAD02_015600 [Eretmocerus hayati]|uniref:Uncharacterized protein n=1 Tax=Eretmocerus hayati TaxID=131215 RepID=A0ACC2P9N8_9HYME|nr:hypothetical protein QAD02_015600 [Eretmocerus hayati]